MPDSKKSVRIPVRRGRHEPPDHETAPETSPAPESATDWRERALRLQAEMENFRKRQRRLADDQAHAAHADLLTRLLPVVDALGEAVQHLRPGDPYDQNVRVAYDELTRVLRNAGVEPIPAEGAPFDPTWHEAVAMIPASPHQQEEMLVAEEELKGYRLGDRLLRPSRVVVARQP